MRAPERSGPRRRTWTAGLALVCLLAPAALTALTGASTAAAPAQTRERSEARSPELPAAPELRRGTHRSGLPWSSGVTPVDISGAQAVRFGRKRGAPVDNVVVYPGRESWDTMLSTFWRRALPSYFDAVEDDLVVSVPLWPSSNSVQNTGTPAQWTQLGEQIATSDPDAYVRIGWEMNIGVPWAITPQNRQAWVRSFRAAATDLLTGCPRCQIVWNPNHGLDKKRVDTRAVFRELKDLITVYAIDNYDIYPPMTDAASRRFVLESRGQFTESLRFARSHGKLFAVPEWGVACNGPGCQWRGHAGGDNPRFIRAVMGWFHQHRRYLAFESYFDEPMRTTRSSLFTRPIGPRAGQAYRQAIRTYRR